jgi:hypothetical protein
MKKKLDKATSKSLAETSRADTAEALVEVAEERETLARRAALAMPNGCHQWVELHVMKEHLLSHHLFFSKKNRATGRQPTTS